MKKILYIFVTVLFSGSVLVWANSPTVTQQIEQKNVRIYVQEMNCQLCVYLVNKVLRNVEGVIATKANMKTQQVNVVASKDVTEQKLLEAIETLKYQAKIIP